MHLLVPLLLLAFSLGAAESALSDVGRHGSDEFLFVFVGVSDSAASTLSLIAASLKFYARALKQ